MEHIKTKTRKIKKIVLVAHDNIGSRRLFESIYSSFDECEFLMIIGRGLYYGQTFFQSVFHLLRKASWLFIFVRLLDLVKYKLKGDTLITRCQKLNIPIIYTKDINSEETLARTKSYDPDILVSVFTMQIYKKDIIVIPKYGSITSHPSILPHYRGLEVFFWVLANNEREAGVSVFYLTEKIDAGTVIRQERFPITDDYTVKSLYNKITEVSGRLLVQAIYDIDSDNIKIIPSEGKGSYYPMPTREAVKRFRKLGKKFF